MTDSGNSLVVELQWMQKYAKALSAVNLDL